MTAAKEMRIAALQTVEELERCVELQGAVWGYSAADLVPKRVFVVANAIGGQVIGAFDEEALAGFVMALPGYRDGEAYLHSHMLAVLPQYRNGGVGMKLKLAQREQALGQGIHRIEWTFDPLEIKNAYLNIARLGAIARRYLANFYGPSTSPLQGGLPTDRLVAEWWLDSPRVEHAAEAIARGYPPAAVKFSGKNVERIAVPAAVSEWKGEPEQRRLALSLQTDTRIALEDAFSRGLAVTGYERDERGNGCYLLQAPAAEEIGSGIPLSLQDRMKTC